MIWEKDGSSVEVRTQGTLADGRPALDEVVVENGFIHVEQTAHDRWFVGITAAGKDFHLNFEVENGRLNVHLSDQAEQYVEWEGDSREKQSNQEIGSEEEQLHPSLPRPVDSETYVADHDCDFYGWCRQQIHYISAGNRFDRERVAAEIENIGRCYEEGFLRDALAQMIEATTSDEPRESRYALWNARREIGEILKRSRSLIPELPSLLTQVYESCLGWDQKLPKECPSIADFDLPTDYVPVEPEYEKDFLAWSRDQARRIRACESFDVPNVVDELGSLGHAKAARLENELAELIAARLKWHYAPNDKTYNAALWILAEETARLHAIETLRSNPSLRNVLLNMLPHAYRRGIFRATIVLHDCENSFPKQSPWTLADLGLLME